MTDAIFDVVAKDKKKKHVAEDVRDAAVHEHRSDQREVNRNRRRLQSRHLVPLTGELLHHNAVARDDVFAGNDLRGNRGESVRESFVVAEALQEHEHEDVREDEDVINYRRRAAIGVVVGDWEKHCDCPVSCSLSLWERVGERDLDGGRLLEIILPCAKPSPWPSPRGRGK